MLESNGSSPEAPDRLLPKTYWRGICAVTVAFFATHLGMAVFGARVVSTELSDPGKKLFFVAFSVAFTSVIPLVLISVTSALIGGIAAIATKRRAISLILMCWFWLMLVATVAQVALYSRALIKFVSTSPQ